MAKGKMSPRQAKEYLRLAAKRYKYAAFVGGEPLLYHREIAELATYARKLGIEPMVMTSAGWVENEAQARDVFGELAAAGIKRIGASWDIYHEELCAREQIVSLARAALEEGMEVAVRITVPSNEDAARWQEAFDDLDIQFEIKPVSKQGRARTLPSSHFEERHGPPSGRCNSVLLPFVRYDGKVYACCGPAFHCRAGSPLYLGDAEEEPLDAILNRAENDPIREMIHLAGPHGLWHLLEESGGRDLHTARDTYTDQCELCLDLLNSAAAVAAVRDHLGDARGQAALAAATMWMRERMKMMGVAPPKPGLNSSCATSRGEVGDKQ